MAAPRSGICAPWIEVADLECDEGDADQRAEAVSVASELLYFYSGSQFSGECALEVTLQREPWEPWGCWPWRVKLGVYPIVEVTAVSEDGVVLLPANWSVQDYRWLLRFDDEGNRRRWNLQGDGVVVEGKYGILPSAAGIRAAKDLACELVKAFVDPDGDCAVGDKVTSLSRQGVSMDMLVLRPAEYREGLLGIKSVDRFLQAVNPGGVRRRARIGNPDLRRSIRRNT